MFKFIFWLIGLVFIASLGFAVYLGWYGSQDTVSWDEDVAIVLGARVFCGNDHEPRPSETLLRRLDKAVGRNNDLGRIYHHRQKP